MGMYSVRKPVSYLGEALVSASNDRDVSPAFLTMTMTAETGQSPHAENSGGKFEGDRHEESTLLNGGNVNGRPSFQVSIRDEGFR